ncbi:hypothetical protein QBC44DRAFT_332634 [Cladorrhinum sp. PSN332]|nr:hypothetical protein QBC44DRAFT_332634 [Cladorrhinum sp. PSN332]
MSTYYTSTAPPGQGGAFYCDPVIPDDPEVAPAGPSPSPARICTTDLCEARFRRLESIIAELETRLLEQTPCTQCFCVGLQSPSPHRPDLARHNQYSWPRKARRTITTALKRAVYLTVPGPSSRESRLTRDVETWPVSWNLFDLRPPADFGLTPRPLPTELEVPKFDRNELSSSAMTDMALSAPNNCAELYGSEVPPNIMDNPTDAAQPSADNALCTPSDSNAVEFNVVSMATEPDPFRIETCQWFSPESLSKAYSNALTRGVSSSLSSSSRGIPAGVWSFNTGHCSVAGESVTKGPFNVEPRFVIVKR